MNSNAKSPLFTPNRSDQRQLWLSNRQGTQSPSVQEKRHHSAFRSQQTFTIDEQLKKAQSDVGRLGHMDDPLGKRLQPTHSFSSSRQRSRMESILSNQDHIVRKKLAKVVEMIDIAQTTDALSQSSISTIFSICRKELRNVIEEIQKVESTESFSIVEQSDEISEQLHSKSTLTKVERQNSSFGSSLSQPAPEQISTSSQPQTYEPSSSCPICFKSDCRCTQQTLALDAEPQAHEEESKQSHQASTELRTQSVNERTVEGVEKGELGQGAATDKPAWLNMDFLDQLQETIDLKPTKKAKQGEHESITLIPKFSQELKLDRAKTEQHGGDFRSSSSKRSQGGVSKRKETTIDIVFLHASPNIVKDRDIQMREGNLSLPALDFPLESETIKAAIDASGREVLFTKMVATKENFDCTIMNAPKVLHISCHGVGSPKYSLLFENIYGAGELVGLKELEEYMQKSGGQIELIFLAACDSEEIGKVFCQSGVKHVICIKNKRQVLDKAAINFTKTFYAKILQGTPICEAFRNAQNATGFVMKKHEANLFTILTRESQDDNDPTKFQKEKHKCFSLPEAKKGQRKCLSQHNLIKQIPAEFKDLRFREKEMSDILQKLVEDPGIVMIVGFRGIGKSVLARNTLHYAAKRKMFPGGILCIKCGQTRNTLSLLKHILRAFLRFFELSNAEKDTVLECSQDRMIELFTEIFNGRQKYNLISKQRNCSNRKSSNFLLCLDNAEELIKNDEQEFISFLDRLNDDCEKLRIIITSDVPISADLLFIKPQTILVPPLCPKLAAQLFYELSEREGCGYGAVSRLDIVSFLLADKNYPFKLIFPELKEEVSDRTREADLANLKGLIRKKMIHVDDKIRALAHHEMFKLIQGNPTSISMTAHLLSNQIFEKDELSLDEVYLQFLKGNAILKQPLDVAGKGVASNYKRQIISLKVSIETSIQLLSQANQRHVELLYFFSCLPGGVTLPQMEKMWGKSGKEVEEGLKIFEQLSFLEHEKKKYLLTQYTQQYLDKSMKTGTKAQHIRKICSYYNKLLSENYKFIGRFKSQHQSNTAQHVPRKGILDSGSDRKALMKDFLKDEARRHDADQEKKSIFERMLGELRNIEHCLNFIIHEAGKHPVKNKTRITEKGHFCCGEKDKDEQRLQPLHLSEADEPTECHDTTSLSPKIAVLKLDDDASSQEAVSNLAESGEESQSSNVAKQAPHDFRYFVHSNKKRLTTMRTKINFISRMKKKPNQKKSVSFRNISELQRPLCQITERSSSDDDVRSQMSGSSACSDSESEEPDGLEHYKTMNPHLPPRKQKKVNQQSQSSPGPQYKTQQFQALQQVVAPEEDIDDFKLHFGWAQIKSAGAQSQKVQFIYEGRLELGIGERRISEHESADSLSDDSSSQNSEPDADLKCASDDDDEERMNSNLSSTGLSETRPRVNTEKIQSKGFQTGKVEGSAKKLRRKSEYLLTKKLTALSHQSTVINKMYNGLKRANALVDRLHHVDFKIDRQISSVMTPSKSLQTTNPRQQVGLTFEDIKMWRKMGIEGTFIVLMLAHTFLTCDFEFCLQIANNDFTFYANQPIFEANQLRFRALASYKQFEIALKEDVNSIEANFEFLVAAIESAENAKQIYGADKETREIQQNCYGLALSCFTLGYIYQNFASELCDARVQHLAEFKDFLLGSGNQKVALTKAQANYSAAYEHFSKTNHLVGMQQCWEHLTELNSDESKQAEMIQWLEKLKQNVATFSEEVGFENSCFTPREHGNDISLMAEIVDRFYYKPLFQSKRQAVDHRQTLADGQPNTDNCEDGKDQSV